MPYIRDDIDDSDVWYKYKVLGWTQREIADYYGVGYTTIYYRLYPEKNRENVRKWREENPDYNKEYGKQWRLENPEYSKEYWKHYKYSEEYKYYSKIRQESVERKEYLKIYEQSDRGKVRQKRFWQSEKGKVLASKHNAKHRDLESIPYNKPFPNSHGHHIDKRHIIHIPDEIHRSISHNVWTGESMEAINEEAMDFLMYEINEEIVLRG